MFVYFRNNFDKNNKVFLATLCLLKKSLYLCSPNWYENKIIINNIQKDEKNISTFQPEKKEQAWLPFKNGYS